MPDETPETTEVIEEDATFLGLTKTDVGEIVVRAIVTTVAVTVVKVLAGKISDHFVNNRSETEEIDEIVEAPSE